MKKRTIGLAIKTQRKAIGMTAEELAKRVGVDRTYISKIEHDIYLPSDQTAENIRKALRLGNKFLQEYYFAKHPHIIGFFGPLKSRLNLKPRSK